MREKLSEKWESFTDWASDQVLAQLVWFQKKIINYRVVRGFTVPFTYIEPSDYTDRIRAPR